MPDQRLANCLDSGSCPSDKDLGMQEEGKIPMPDPVPPLASESGQYSRNKTAMEVANIRQLGRIWKFNFRE